MPEKVQEEIDRIKNIAGIYVRLQSLIPDYDNDYMEAFVEIADRFDNIAAKMLENTDEGCEVTEC